MAATDLSAIKPPNGLSVSVHRISLPAGAGNVREVILPKWCRRISFTCKENDDSTDTTGGFATIGTDGNAVGNDHMPTASGGIYTTAVAAGSQTTGGSIFLACGAATGFAHLSLEAV
jgi:hypothetical protein